MEHDVRVERFIIATLANSASVAAELGSGPCSTHPGKNTHKHIDQPPFLDRRFPRVQQHSSLWKYKDVFLMLLSVTNHGAGTSLEVSTQLYSALLWILSTLFPVSIALTAHRISVYPPLRFRSRPVVHCRFLQQLPMTRP